MSLHGGIPQKSGVICLKKENGDYLCDCTSYEFILEPGDYVLILLKSSSSVSGRFTAWQEIPLEKQLLGLSVLLVGLAGIGISAILLKKK